MLLTAQFPRMVGDKDIVIALNDNEAESLKAHKVIRIIPAICNLIVSSPESYQEHLFVIRSLLKNILKIT